MINKQYEFRGRDGYSLVEVMIAMTILAIIALGALKYQYYAALHTHAAMAKMTSTRTAQLLLDDWKSAGGSAAYNPVNLNLGFTDSDSDGTDYEITKDNLPMQMRLSYDDIENDNEAQITLRKITVQVNWRNDYKTPTGQPEEETSMEMSTFVRVDASGG